MTKIKAAAKRPGNSKQTILHIYHFGSRYEFDPYGHIDRFKVGPLKYVKKFIGSGEDDETVSYARQMTTIENKTNGDTLYTCFSKLVDISAHQRLSYRGYLLDETFRPANVSTIAGWLRRDVKTMKKIIKALLDVRLLEEVPLPDFKPVKVRRRKKPVISGNDRRTTGKRPAADRKSLLDNGKGKRQTASGNRKGKDLNPATANAGKGSAGKWNAEAEGKISQEKDKAAKTKHKAETKGRMPKPKDKAIANAQGESKGQAGSISVNLPPLPNVPTHSEAGVEQTQTDSAPPLRSANVNLDTLYDPEARAFAVEVYRLLKVPYSPDTAQCRRELGNFASAWNEAQKAGLSPSTLQRLWQVSVKSAASIGNKRRRIKFSKSAEAVWRNEFNKRLAAFKTGSVSVADG